MKHKIIKKIKDSNKRGLAIFLTDSVTTPYFYASNEGFVMNLFHTKKEALKRWNFDNSNKSNGQWSNDFS